MADTIPCFRRLRQDFELFCEVRAAAFGAKRTFAKHRRLLSARARNRCAIARCAGSPTASAVTGGKITVQIGEAVIVLTSSLKQFRLDKIEVCCSFQKLVRPMTLQGRRKADRAEVVERDRFATPNPLKSHGERNLLSPVSNTCAITPKLCTYLRPRLFEDPPLRNRNYV